MHRLYQIISGLGSGITVVFRIMNIKTSVSQPFAVTECDTDDFHFCVETAMKAVPSSSSSLPNSISVIVDSLPSWGDKIVKDRLIPGFTETLTESLSSSV